MKIIASLSLLASAGSVVADTPHSFSPPRIGYNSLVDDISFENSRSLFVDALTKVGLVSITDIPFKSSTKQETLSLIHDCAEASEWTQEESFPDGTRRRTLATHTVPGQVQTMEHGPTNRCDKFTKASTDFRHTVAEVTNAFAARLNAVLDLDEKAKPLLNTKNGDYSFSDLADVVTNGEHLEHFHSYERTSSDVKNQEQTIDIHTDQGLFIAFTPGVLISTQEKETKAPLVTNGFYIELQDGSLVMVNFNDEDDIVFMLGDGVNQYINPKTHELELRAAPHALTMPLHTTEEARVWYGRMVLPPMDAVHPQHDGQTFGDIRQALIEGDSTSAASLACSGTMSVRNLNDASCDGDNTLWCWHRCMNGTDFGVSEEMCGEQGLDFRCVNPRRQLYVKGHGDYYPACIDATNAMNATAFPALREEPWDAEECTSDMLTSFKTVSSYDHEVNLGNATLLWSITEDGTMLDGKLVFNGLFGWLALGFANEGARKNGMHGATIIMALPGGNYSAEFGLDLDMDPTVDEYIIDPQESSFRHWMTPVSAQARHSGGSSSYSVEATDCFTAISFKTDHIHEKHFNLDGMDDLIWAANAEDYYVGYHGRQNRARFHVEWKTGVAFLDDGEQIAGSGNSGASSSTIVGALAAAMVAMVATFI